MENNIQSINQNEENSMSTIEKLFQEFLNEGGEPKVTEFKRYLDKLVNSEIKQLCGRSSRGATGDDWRSDLKSRFGGRGAKWVFVSIEEIMPTLATFEESEVKDYVGFINKAGKAWIRYAGPRIHDGAFSASFEVRISGSTIDHPKHLHYIPVTNLDNVIESMNTTPFALNLEETKKVKAEVTEEVPETIDEIIETEEIVNDEIDELSESYDEESYDDDDEDFDSAF